VVVLSSWLQVMTTSNLSPVSDSRVKPHETPVFIMCNGPAAASAGVTHRFTTLGLFKASVCCGDALGMSNEVTVI
jgi:hypothetical protein